MTDYPLFGFKLNTNQIFYFYFHGSEELKYFTNILRRIKKYDHDTQLIDATRLFFFFRNNKL